MGSAIVNMTYPQLSIPMGLACGTIGINYIAIMTNQRCYKPMVCVNGRSITNCTAMVIDPRPSTTLEPVDGIGKVGYIEGAIDLHE